MTYYVHSVPGRLRVKIPRVKGNALRAAEVEKLLEGVSGVRSGTASMVTGSVVVSYDPEQVDADGILEVLRQRDYFDPSRVISDNQYMASGLQKTSEVLSKVLVNRLVDMALQGSALSFLTVLI